MCFDLRAKVLLALGPPWFGPAPCWGPSSLCEGCRGRAGALWLHRGVDVFGDQDVVGRRLGTGGHRGAGDRRGCRVVVASARLQTRLTQTVPLETSDGGPHEGP